MHMMIPAFFRSYMNLTASSGSIPDEQFITYTFFESQAMAMPSIMSSLWATYTPTASDFFAASSI